MTKACNSQVTAESVRESYGIRIATSLLWWTGTCPGSKKRPRAHTLGRFRCRDGEDLASSPSPGEESEARTEQDHRGRFRHGLHHAEVVDAGVAFDRTAAIRRAVEQNVRDTVRAVRAHDVFVIEAKVQSFLNHKDPFRNFPEKCKVTVRGEP